MLITDFIENYKKAVYTKNVDEFVSLYDENILIFDLWMPWMSQGMAPLRESTQEWFSSLINERVLVDFEIVHSQETATMSFLSAFVTFAATTLEGQMIRSMQNRLTWILEFKQSQWKITHQHTSAPVDFSNMKVSFKRS